MTALPYDLEAEISLLAALLIEPDTQPTSRPQDFYSDRHRIVYESLTALKERGESLTPVTLADHLRGRRALENAGGVDFVAALLDAVPSSVGYEHHARIVRDKASLRRLIAACQETMQQAMTATDPGEVFAAAEARMLSATDVSRRNDGYIHVGEAVLDAMAMIEKAGETTDGMIGMRSGLPKLDMMTSGFQPGDVTVIAARPSMGKSAIGWQFAEKAAMQGHRVAIASYEMAGGQLGRRGLSRLSHIDSQRIKRGQLEPAEWKALAEAGSRLGQLPIWIDDQPPRQIGPMRSVTRRHKRKHGVDMVVVDYVQQMGGGGNNRNNEIEEISRGLKGMARELDVHVLALAQLNRKVEDRKPPRPMLSDLRDSGAIEQDADNVLLLWRPEYYFDDSTPQAARDQWEGKAEAILAKQRDGETGRILMTWNAPRLMFTQIDERESTYRIERRRA